MADVFGVHGSAELIKAFHEIDRGMQKASLAATSTVSRKLKAEIRKELNGPPRWNHHAGRAAGHYTLAGAPRHAERSGPPGKLTGDLRKGVGFKKPKLDLGGQIKGGVGVGGAGIKRNFFKYRWEEVYPFFAPACERVGANFEGIYVAAYRKALTRYGL